MVIALILVGICPRLCAPHNPNPLPQRETMVYDPRVLIASHTSDILSCVIFFLNLGGVILAVFCTFLACRDSTLACVSAGQRGCATFLFVAALYIVEGLFKAPPLYRLEGFQPESSSLRLGLRSERRVLARSLTHYLRFAPDEN